MAHMTDQPYQKTNGLDDPFPAIRWARYASVTQNQHGVARIAPSLTFPAEQRSPRCKPRSVSCCGSPPTKGTPAQAMPPDLDGSPLSYRDSCDEFPRRWHTATPQGLSTTRPLPVARIVLRQTHVADGAISRPRAP